MPNLALSTWSLHRALGPIYPGLDRAPAARPPDHRYGAGTITLHDVPEVAVRLGVSSVDICHFHFPRTDVNYLRALRARLDAAGIGVLTLLVDDGDLTATDSVARRRDRELIASWIDVAAEIGAARVRVVAGDAAPGPEALRWSSEGLRALAAYGKTRSVAVVTENWRRLAMDPRALGTILDELDGTVGLCADFGNYTGPDKYDQLRALLPRASSIHAKAAYTAPGAMDVRDFTRCLDLARDAGFSGSYVLIFDGPGDEQDSLGQMARVVEPYLADASRRA